MNNLYKLIIFFPFFILGCASNLTEENKQRLRGQILSYVQSGLSGQYFPATDPDARQRATNELIKQAAAIIGVNPTELGVAPSDTATGETTTAGKYSYKQVSE